MCRRYTNGSTKAEQDEPAEEITTQWFPLLPIAEDENGEEIADAGL